MNSTDWFRVDLWPNVKGKQSPSGISRFQWGSAVPSQSLSDLPLSDPEWMPPFVGTPGTSLAHPSQGPASVILTQWALWLQIPLGCEELVSLLSPHSVRLMTPRLIALPKPRCGECFPKELPHPGWGTTVLRAVSECWLWTFLLPVNCSSGSRLAHWPWALLAVTFGSGSFPVSASWLPPCLSSRIAFSDHQPLTGLLHIFHLGLLIFFSPPSWGKVQRPLQNLWSGPGHYVLEKREETTKACLLMIFPFHETQTKNVRFGLHSCVIKINVRETCVDWCEKQPCRRLPRYCLGNISTLGRNV